MNQTLSTVIYVFIPYHRSLILNILDLTSASATRALSVSVIYHPQLFVPFKLNALKQFTVINNNICCVRTWGYLQGHHTKTYPGCSFPRRCGPCSPTRHRSASAAGCSGHDSDTETHLLCTPSHSQSVSRETPWIIRNVCFLWQTAPEQCESCTLWSCTAQRTNSFLVASLNHAKLYWPHRSHPDSYRVHHTAGWLTHTLHWHTRTRSPNMKGALEKGRVSVSNNPSFFFLKNHSVCRDLFTSLSATS